MNVKNAGANLFLQGIKEGENRKTSGGLDVRTWLFVQIHRKVFQSKRSLGFRLGENARKKELFQTGVN